MAPLVASETIEQIRNANDIVEVIGTVLPLRRSGSGFVALCPFHREKTPSFHVNPHRQLFHCFGCHKGGDVFTFIRDYEGVDFGEAVKRLADRAGILLEYEKDPNHRRERSVKQALLEIHDQIATRWHDLLLRSAPAGIARDYLRQRGVDDSAIRAFRLGFAPDAWSDTVEWAQQRGHPLDLVEKAGLILRRDASRGYYDRFRGRLTFPINDEQGRVIGFSARLLTDDPDAPKYVNSPETPIFNKRRVMYGLDRARRPMLDAGSAVICEGQLDLIACMTHGIENAVAPQGTAFGTEHARILKRYVNEVILCFDSDKAGQNAVIRVLDDLLASDLAIRVATLPPPHDPDSFIRSEGAEAFRRLLESAPGFFDFYLDHLCRQYDVATDRGRMEILKAMGTALKKTGHDVLLDSYAQKTAVRLRVTPTAVRSEFQGLKPPRAYRPNEPQPAMETPGFPRPSSQEFWLIKLVFADPANTSWAADHLNPEWIQNEAVRKILVPALDLTRDTGKAPHVGRLITEMNNTDLGSLLSEAVSSTEEIPQPLQQLHDLVLRLRNQFIERRLVNLVQQAARPDCPPEKIQALLLEQAELRNQRRHPLESLYPRPEDF